jgi:predicted nucleic acid-binding protein
LIIEAALQSRCEVLLTEDLQAGQNIDGKLTIINPF